MKSWIFEKINKVDKPQAKLTKKGPSNKIRYEKGDIIADTTNSETHKDIFLKICIEPLWKI